MILSKPPQTDYCFPAGRVWSPPHPHPVPSQNEVWVKLMQVKKQQLEPNMKQQTDSKLGKEYVKAVYCHPAYLT